MNFCQPGWLNLRNSKNGLEKSGENNKVKAIAIVNCLTKVTLNTCLTNFQRITVSVMPTYDIKECFWQFRN